MKEINRYIEDLNGEKKCGGEKQTVLRNADLSLWWPDLSAIELSCDYTNKVRVRWSRYRNGNETYVRPELKGFKEKCVLKIKENKNVPKSHSLPPVPDLNAIEFFWGEHCSTAAVR
jgi:hypothetical protein